MWPEGESAWTKEQANALLRLVDDMFHRRDIDALVSGFTEDCVFRFAEQPEQRGRDALRRFFAARFARPISPSPLRRGTARRLADELPGRR
jgi:ketosteroid isomerase-like protein